MDIENALSVKFSWDKDSTSYFTSRLLGYVKRKEIEFTLEAKNGSILATFLIGYAGSIAAEPSKDAIKFIVTQLLQATQKRAMSRKKTLPSPQLHMEGKPISYEDYTANETDEIKEFSTFVERKLLMDNSNEHLIEKLIEDSDKNTLKRLSKLIQNRLESLK